MIDEPSQADILSAVEETNLEIGFKIAHGAALGQSGPGSIVGLHTVGRAFGKKNAIIRTMSGGVKTWRSAPTISDVAKRAGVSEATVSRVLNGTTPVKAERRRVVEEAIAALDFVPRVAARSLKSGKSMEVGAIFPRLDSVLFGGVLNDLQARLDAVGYTLTTMTTNYDPELEYRRVRQMVARHVDFLILVGSQHAPKTDALIQLHAIPRVNIWSWDEDSAVPQIGFCNRSAGAMAARHLVDLGHRRVGLISGDPEGNDRAASVISGVTDVLADAGVLDDTLFAISKFSVAAGETSATKLLSRSDPPTGIVCTSDIIALGTLQASRQLGFQVPEDLSVVGFDNTELAECGMPQLTSIHTPRDEMTALLAQEIGGHLTEGTPVPSHRLDCRLTRRTSTSGI